MRIIQNFGFVGLLLASVGTQLAAQQSAHKGWVAGAALPWATDNLKQWTNQSFMGLCLDGAYQIPIAESGNCFRLGLGLNSMPGKNQYPYGDNDSPWKINLTGIQVNLDVLFQIGPSPLSIITGLSLNSWFKNVSGIDPWDQPNGNASVSGNVKNAFGKYGFRLGAEYAMNRSLSLAVMLQMTELGTDMEFYPDHWFEDADGKVDRGNVGYFSVNPTWVQFGVKYKF